MVQNIEDFGSELQLPVLSQYWIGVFFTSEKSRFAKPEPRTIFRPGLPPRPRRRQFLIRRRSVPSVESVPSVHAVPSVYAVPSVLSEVS